MRFSTLLLAALLPAQAVMAQNTDWTAVNLAITDAHVIPGYERFAAATKTLHAEGDALCANPDEASLNRMREAFGASFDAWQGVQHIQFGPITYFNWNYRLQFWPDDNGTGARQFTALIAAADTAVLESETFARQSVGVQGFPALERLLYEDNALQLLRDEPFRCQLTQAISANLDEIASGVHERWVEEFRDTVATADERGFFESAEDATIDYLKALVESIRRIQQQKLEAPLGDSPAGARERRAEAWRSDRSVRNLQLNARALQDIFNAGEPALRTVLPEADMPGIDAGFERLLTATAALPESMNAALADTEGYAALRETRDSLDALYELVEAALKETDLYLGFNSLDGD
ncbi:MAG TPA: imelysin family protein [Hyphomicrobiales bacterium]|nr:imelysin family protein [Hyphomicrobiales bacterium]